MLTFTADHEIWLAGEQFQTGDHSVDDPSAELVKHAGSAHTAGEITVTDGLDESHVQSQADAEAAYATAQADGTWQEGNVAQWELQQAQAAAEVSE